MHLSADDGVCDIAPTGITVRSVYTDTFNLTFSWPTMRYGAVGLAREQGSHAAAVAAG